MFPVSHRLSDLPTGIYSRCLVCTQNSQNTDFLRYPLKFESIWYALFIALWLTWPLCKRWFKIACGSFADTLFGSLSCRCIKNSTGLDFICCSNCIIFPIIGLIIFCLCFLYRLPFPNGSIKISLHGVDVSSHSFDHIVDLF